MNKKISYASAILSVALLSACGGGDKSKQAGPPQAQAVPVTTYAVNRENVTTSDSYPGTVVALNEVELRAEVNGYITGIYVADGQTVSKGQKLYEIDRTRYQAAYRAAQAQVATAKANLAKAQKDAERYQRLASQDAIAKQRVDYAQTDLQTAQAQVSAAEANLATAATDLNRSIIVAPVSGKLGISMQKKGSLVTAGSTLINTLSSPNPIGVDIFVDQQNIPHFLNLQKAKTAAFSLILADQTRYTSEGKIIAVDRQVDPQTGTIKVRASFDNASGRLTAGMTLNVEVPNQQSGEQIVIPYASVSEQLGHFSVFVIGDSSKAVQTSVTLGVKTGEMVVVTDGLKGGETIVNKGVQNVKDGAVVKPGEDNPAAAQNGKPAGK